MLQHLSLNQRIAAYFIFTAALQVHVIAGSLLGWSASTLIAGSLIFGALTLWFYMYGLVDAKKFITAFVGALNRVATGDLSQNVVPFGSGVAQMGLTTIRNLQDSLRDVISTLNNGARQVSNASSEIASGNLELSHRTEQGSADLQNAAGALRAMTDTARQSSDAMHEASSLSQSASQLVRHNGKVVSDAVDAMSAVSQSSRKISDIISVIDGIAFQTNILALNAAVEAARAGEQGRGFAVVASEVRLLAGRSAEAAKEIKDLISRSVEQVDSGSSLVNDAGTRMQEVVNSVERVASLISQANQLAQTQSQGLREVSESVDRLDQSMQQNAALVEEGAAAAGTLREQAHSLTDLVSRFKL